MNTKPLLVIIALTVAASLAFGQNVSYDFDKATDFSKFKTYAWIRGTNLDDELNHRRVVDAIDTQLALKGLAKVDVSGNPDLLVAYHASFDKNLQITGFSSGWGGYVLGGNRSGVARAEEILVGTIAVDMVDAKAGLIVWRGTATREVDVHANAEKREKNINNAAAKVFRNYPPKK